MTAPDSAPQTPGDVIGLVLHFRTPQHTATCLQSLRAAGIPDVVVVDNSADGGASWQQLEALQAACRRATPGPAPAGVIHRLDPGRNLGFAAGVALGLSRARELGPRPVLLINSDAWLAADALPTLLPQLAQADVVVPALRDPQTLAGPPPFHHYHRATGLLFAQAHGLDCVQVPCGCCLLLSPALVQPDLFDTDFFFYLEDVMLGEHLARQGRRVVACAQAVVWHAGAASARRGSLFYEYHMNRSHWRLARRLARGPGQAWLFGALRLFTLSARAGVRSLRSRSWTPWHGLLLATLDALRGETRDLTPKP